MFQADEVVRCDVACSGTATLRRNGSVVGRENIDAAGRTVAIRVRPTNKLRGTGVKLALDVRGRKGHRGAATVTRTLALTRALFELARPLG